METAAVYPRLELLQVADAVAREKGIEREEVLEAMEQAIQKAGRSKYGHELDIRAEINRRNGEIHLFRYRQACEVEEIENDQAQLTLEDAKAIKPDIEMGGFIIDPLPPIDFGRIAAQTAKQVIVQKVRDAERKRQYEEYKDRTGEIVTGLVKRVEFGNVMVDLGRAEAIMRREELIPREMFRNGDRVRAYIYDVREELRGPQIFVSRTRPDFMAKLFAQEVPEIYDGIIEIRAVARDPGSRAKIAVISNDSGIDPVGACVGMRGSRVQAVVSELQGEKIDIIPWSQDTATFVVNALAPAEVVKVVLDEESGSLEVIVPDDQLSLAIGRRGQNVRLASHLTGWDIDILTEEEESIRRQEESRQRTELFIEALDVDDVIAHLLVTEGFASVEDVAFVPVDDLAEIEGFDEDVAEELRERARTYLTERDAALTARRKELGVTDEMSEIEGISPAMAVILGEAGVRELDDLGDLSSDELRAILGGANQPEPQPEPEPEMEPDPEALEEIDDAEGAAPAEDAEAGEETVEAVAEAVAEDDAAPVPEAAEAAEEAAEGNAADTAEAGEAGEAGEATDAEDEAGDTAESAADESGETESGEIEGEVEIEDTPAPAPAPVGRNRGEQMPVIEIGSVDDVAELEHDQMRRLMSLSELTTEEANEIIMAARAHWFDDEPDAEAAEAGETAEAGAEAGKKAETKEKAEAATEA